jgi:Mg/Co/Ni transporter MgtE
MSIQSKINSALASTTGAIYGIKIKLKDRQTKAMKIVDEVKEAQKNQRRNFMDYLKKLPTNYGVNVGSLSPDVQKKIAKTYTPSQRRKIMNEMDKGIKK